jgi:NAD(P)-dependent dehydrogenase (short-subunit alcohol dehydrogenase family)
VVQADVTRVADLERFVDTAVARWGRLDGLVNNAGKSAAGRIDAGGGAIVNVLNLGAKAAGAASLPTTASRAAGLAITKAASKDLGEHGIRVNAVLIGRFRHKSSRHERAFRARSLVLKHADRHLAPEQMTQA